MDGWASGRQEKQKRKQAQTIQAILEIVHTERRAFNRKPTTTGTEKQTEAGGIKYTRTDDTHEDVNMQT